MDDPLRKVYLSAAGRRLLDAAAAGRRACTVELPPPGAVAFLAWQVFESLGRHSVWVVDGPRTLDAFMRDLEALAAGREGELACLPARETPGAGREGARADIAGDRIDALRRCRTRPPGLLATCVQALLQPTLSPGALDRTVWTVRAGAALDPEVLAGRLDGAGYAFGPQVQEKGAASRRGGIVDAWPPDAPWPFRIEFNGDAVESVRTFDPFGQRSRERCPEAVLSPAAEWDGNDCGVLPPDHLPPDTLWVWVDPARLAEHAEMHRRAVDAGGPGMEALLARVEARSGARRVTLRPAGETVSADFAPALRAVEGLAGGAPEAGLPAPDAVERLRDRWVGLLLEGAAAGRPVVFVFATGGTRDRFAETYFPGGAGPPGVISRLGRLSGGFTAGAGELTVVAEPDLYGTRRELRGRYDRHAPRRGPAAAPGRRVQDGGDMQPGDLVVHVEHGIGRYLGLYEIAFNGQPQEVLAIEYADGRAAPRARGAGAPAQPLRRDGRASRPSCTGSAARAGRARRQAAERAVRGPGRLAARDPGGPRGRCAGTRSRPTRPGSASSRRPSPTEETADQLRGHRRRQARHGMRRARWTG